VDSSAKIGFRVTKVSFPQVGYPYQSVDLCAELGGFTCSDEGKRAAPGGKALLPPRQGVKCTQAMGSELDGYFVAPLELRAHGLYQS
jgi:hypothetical protein